MQINTNAVNSFIHLPENTQAQGRKVLKMVHNDRMAGGVPSWQPAQNEKERIAADMNTAISQPGNTPSTDTALALQNNTSARPLSNQSAFGFGDLLDMVNPLQHIPIISSVYRELSGDQIRPVSRLIGGGLFGGVAGLAGGLVNIIAEEETGRDIAGNALHFVTSGEGPRYKSSTAQNTSPERALEQAIASVDEDSLPAMMLAFTDQKAPGSMSNRPSIEQKVPFREL